MRIERFRVRSGDRTALQRHDPDDTGPFGDKDEARAHLQKGLARLDTLQERLYAQDRYALLLIFQGMDAAGKDSAIRHVMSGVSPQGTDVHAFKQPSAEELDHDYLWRAVNVLPGRGRIAPRARASCASGHASPQPGLAPARGAVIEFAMPLQFAVDGLVVALRRPRAPVPPEPR